MNAVFAIILFIEAFIFFGLAIEHLGEPYLFILWGQVGLCFGVSILLFIFFIKDYFIKKQEDKK
jgi:hypothetical protein